MKFYKAITEKHDYFTGYTTVINELITQKERDSKFRYLSDDCFTIVEVSKKKNILVFWCKV